MKMGDPEVYWPSDCSLVYDENSIADGLKFRLTQTKVCLLDSIWNVLLLEPASHRQNGQRLRGAPPMIYTKSNNSKFRSRDIRILVFLSALLMSGASHAEVIDFPQEELAQESVLPKFDRPESVKKRNVVTANRFELGGYYGWNIVEPIQNQSKFGLNLGYHWSEESAFMLNYSQWSGGLNKLYTDGLAESPNNLDFSRAPKLKYSVFAHYEWNIFYGKISLTKQGVMNLTTYPIFGLGMTAYEHKNYPGVDAGIGQKFYFGKRMALRADLKFQYSEKPSPFLKGKMKPTDPSPNATDFKDKWEFGTILDIGFTFLL